MKAPIVILTILIYYQYQAISTNIVIIDFVQIAQPYIYYYPQSNASQNGPTLIIIIIIIMMIIGESYI